MGNRSCKSGKVSSGSTEAEYRIVLDNFIGDLLTTLHLPEWPAAEVLLTVCCRTMVCPCLSLSLSLSLLFVVGKEADVD